VESGIEVLGTRVHRVPNRYRVALVIEGGGSRGMFSAGMCLGLEELGLESVFDAVYRASGRFIG
jgi:predicted acylesterase/phospholipase RssA